MLLRLSVCNVSACTRAATAHAGDGKPATLVLTDVEASTELWEWDRVTMMEAISIHDRIMRANLSQYCGYEVRCSQHTAVQHAMCMRVPENT